MKTLKRVLALLLILTLTITEIPAAALADDRDEDDIRMEIMATPSVQGSLGDNPTYWALEKLGGSALSSLAGYGMDEAYKAIFGSDSTRILAALDEIKGRLVNIETEIKNLSSKLDEKELRGNLDSFAEFFSNYAAPYDQLCGYKKDLANDDKLTDIFMQQLYWGTNRNLDTASQTVIAAAKALGNRMTLTLSGDYNIFGAFDKLERYKNHWEHQGYDLREQYRTYIIDVYTLYNATGQIACQKVIDAHQGDGLSDKNIRMQAQRDLDDLIANAKKVDEMNKRCAIVRHPAIRIFRDTKDGRNLYAFYQDFYEARMAPLDVYNWKHLETTEYMQSMIRTPNPWRGPGNGGTEVISQQPWRGLFEDIYKAYGGQKTLYDIFFDPKEGNFINNAGHLPKGTRFATDYYVYKRVSGNDYEWRTNVVTDKGKLNETVVLAHLGFSNFTSQFNSLKISSEQFFSVNEYWGVINQGTLKCPGEPPKNETADLISGLDYFYQLPYPDTVTLAAQEKTDAIYQWFVSIGDNGGFREIEGETNATYTLPPLEPSMHGWMYRCATIENQGTDEEIYTLADPVTLRLMGDGVPEAVTEHDVDSVEELTAALESMVAGGDWYGHTLRLTADIDYPLPISLPDGVVIDLNGYTLNVQPDSNAQPNIDPEGNKAKVAAVYVYDHGYLITLGDGQFNITAGEGVDYGVYAGEGSTVNLHDVTLESRGGNAVLATGGGIVNVGEVNAAGEKAIGVECYDGGSINVTGSVAVTGDASCGVYMSAGNSHPQEVDIGGDVTVSGTNGRGVFLDVENARLTVAGNVNVSGGTGGVLAGQGSVEIKGNVNAPANAINAWNGAAVTVRGNAVAIGDNAFGVYASGAKVRVLGNVTSSTDSGVGISAGAWDMVDPVISAFVTVDGKISAATPLRLGNLPVEESERAETTTKEGYYTYTDEINTIWARPDSPEVVDTCTVTFDQNDGDSQTGSIVKKVTPGNHVGTLPTAPTRLGYTFMGWNTQANGNGTAFTAATVVNDSITVYAQWSRNSSGGGGDGDSKHISTSTSTHAPTPTTKTETKVSGHTAIITATAQATVDSGGHAAVTVDRTQLSSVMEKAAEEAKQQGAGTASGVEIKVGAPADATAIATTVPRETVNQALEKGIGTLIISTPVFSITFDAQALADLTKQEAGDIKISAAKVPASSLTPEAQLQVGDKPVLDLQITCGDKTITQLAGDISVSIPYTPKQGEDTCALVIYRINHAGAPEVVVNSIYDPATGQVNFKTNNWTRYALRYNKISFKDVPGSAWYSQPVAFIAAREITGGTEDGNFSPTAGLTRGQLVVMLMKAYDIAPDANPTDNFADAGNTYYTGYLGAAKRLNIAGGVGNNMFAPNKEITRQEMLALLHNTLQSIGRMPLKAAGKPLSAFTDADKIAPWARESVALLVETGTIGGSDGKLNPTGITTRAEMAQILYNLLSK